MSQPLVCALMLVNSRPAMTYRAIASFRAQTYSNAVLVVWDTGAQRVEPKQEPFDRVWWWTGTPRSIGAMRNDAIAWALSGPTPHPDIFVHADSDDVMHKDRLSEQVALLQSSGAEVVGYRECAFWDSRKVQGGGIAGAWVRGQAGEAWIYRAPDPRHIVGASMAYTRATWERNKFRDINTGEDYHFAMRCNVVGVSGLNGNYEHTKNPLDGSWEMEPRLICGIHGSNTADYSKLSRQTWRREPGLDRICAERMKL